MVVQTVSKLLKDGLQDKLTSQLDGVLTSSAAALIATSSESHAQTSSLALVPQPQASFIWRGAVQLTQQF